MNIYVVKENDSIDKIAEEFQVDVNQLVYDNQLIYPYALAIGQALFINDTQLSTTIKYNSNGFAYPFISRWVLEQTLPFLTELSIFSYGFTEEGYIIDPVLDVEWMIELAEEYGTASILTLTPLGEDGKFNNNLIHVVLNNEEARKRLIDELISTMINMRYKGVNVDFEYILAEDRDIFTQFVREVTHAVNDKNGVVTVDLAPKTSDEQKGLLYEGKDYAALGDAANNVLLMTYEWGYTYGPAMAVAPINKVRQVLDYAVSKIENSKINLGIPNYGYDWTLPYEAGTSKATTIGNVEAIRIAIEYGVEIQFDEVSQAPFFRYSENGIVHEVWFEDVRSIKAKIELVKEYGLMGTGCWQIMRFFRGMWLVQQSFDEL